MPYPTLARRAAAEHWSDARDAHRARTAEKAEEKAAEFKAETEAKIDARAHRFGLAAMDKAAAMLGAADDPVALKALVAALRDAHELTRIAARLTPAPQPNGGSPDGALVEIVIEAPGGTIASASDAPLPGDAPAAAPDADTAPVPG